ncbi:MAG TPA: SRPBCC family protein [Bryobacteraceae bacterium]|nr:SRPBCC family protein [Bryobacteraceae bacterium]
MARRIGTDDIIEAAPLEPPSRWQVARAEAASRTGKTDKLARGLGWFSIGLGALEVLAPRLTASLAGTRNHRGLLRFYGMREIAAGAGILTQSQRAPWLWARVGGDILDLASLAGALGSRRNQRGKTIFSMGAVAGVTALDVMCAWQLTQAGELPGRGTKRAEANLLVNRPPAECYRFWRRFEDLPRFMSYLQSVRADGDRRSHWVARGPGNTRIEWDAELVDDVPDRRISWRSLPGSDLFLAGSVEFEPAPGERGTIVRVQMEYGHPAQALGGLASLIGRHPEQMIHKDLRRFKQVMETGEVLTTEGQPAGRRSGATWLDNLAR